MSTATAQPPPVVPPRPSRSQEKDDQSSGTPLIPPRPSKARSKSPSMDRFAPSPLNEDPFHVKPPHRPRKHGVVTPADAEEAIDRCGSVNMPSLGEEGNEYATVTEELEEELRESTSSPEEEETPTVGGDLEIHAPKPSLPAISAKQRVMAVTRTDSIQAASYGIGKASVAGSTAGEGDTARAKSISSQGSGESTGHDQRKHDIIPEIGIQVPMFRDAGDVQAPAPAPTAAGNGGNGHDNESASGHTRAGSRGPPPGSYGMHGHGVVPDDKLDQAYYEKHPEKYRLEHLVQLHERKHDFNMSSEELNRLVRDTVNRGSGLATHEFVGTPSEEIGFQASDEYVTRIVTPHRPVDDHGDDALSKPVPADEGTIHIDEKRRSEPFSGHVDDEDDNDENLDESHLPILASDEVQKSVPGQDMYAAVEPRHERGGSEYEMEKPTSPPTGPPTHPVSLRSIPAPTPPKETKATQAEEQVPDDEPLFQEGQLPSKDDAPEASDQAQSAHRHNLHFPSKDIWEDSPQSALQTATVSTPEIDASGDDQKRVPPREETETPQQAFARRFEALAEQESRAGVDPFTDHRKPATPAAPHLPEKTKPKSQRPALGNRFPSKDVWEDVPESHMYQATVSTPQQDEDEGEDEPAASASASARPVAPARPLPKPKPDQFGQKPVVSDRPKPQIPARPSKLSSAMTPPLQSEGVAAAKPKPAVPARLGGKIAALQAGFMSDLNKRLQLGPQAAKKEEPAPAQEAAEEVKDKAPLSDARKGRARGPQRRAPAKSPAPAAAEAAQEKPAEALQTPNFSFSLATTAWEIDPEDGNLEVGPREEKGVLGEKKMEDKVRTESQPLERESATEGEPQAEDKKDSPEPPQSVSEPEAEPEPEPKPQPEPQPEVEMEVETETETKTLAASLADESVPETTIVKEEGAPDKIESVHAEDTAEP